MIVYDYKPEAEVIASIIGKPWEQTTKMKCGTAWHTLVAKFPDMVNIAHHCKMLGIDNEKGLKFPALESDGYVFAAADIEMARNEFGPGIWELKATRVVETEHGPCTLVAKADHVNGLIVTDNKAKFSSIDISDHDPDLQWRCYLFCHRAKVFRYLTYEFREADHRLMEGIGYCSLKAKACFRFYDYIGLEGDVMHWINEFLGWASHKGLLRYLHRDVD